MHVATGRIWRASKLAMVLGASVASASVFGGCERKEKILDIETPRGEIEVERSKETGRVDVEVNRDRPNGGVEVNVDTNRP